MVEYFEIKELPGKPMFRCDRRQATIQVQSCAEMWRQANDRGAPERLDLCKNCPLGARHAGVNEISLSPLRGASVCARCHQGTTRLIRGHLCVSCANRFYERLKGKNAKGKFPSRLPPLDPRQIMINEAGDVRALSLEHSQDSVELFVTALRDCSKRVCFGFLSAPRGNNIQLRLF